MSQVTARTMRRARRDTTQTVHLPPPDGINVADSAASLTPADAMAMTNLIRAEYGLRSRLGYQEHVTGINSGAAVRTILPYSGSSRDGSKDKLFACAEDGIYDCTASTATPTRVFAFATASAESGWCVGTAFTTAANKFLVVCDEANGYLLYTESTNTWAQVASGGGAGQIDGTDPAKFVAVVSWKSRLWFVERNSTRAWYLPVGQIAGAVTQFDFGTKLRYGGQLIGLWDWTVNGGLGIDSNLVAISSAGDVAIYQGTDPSSAATFGINGVWYCGQVPAGRRIATDIGGDLLILTSLGIVPLSRITQGGEKLDPSIYASRKIQPLINSAMAAYASQRGWDLRLQPADSALLVLMPAASGPQQYAMSTATKGWSLYDGLPMVCGDVWRGVFYFGTSDGRVCSNAGYVDGLKRDGTGATPIKWSFLSGFSELGAPRQKRVQMIAPDFITTGLAPSWAARARYDWDTTPISDSTIASGSTSGALWGSALWDSALWGYGVGTAGGFVGSWGMGAHVAVAINGSSTTRTILAGASVTWDAGGLL